MQASAREDTILLSTEPSAGTLIGIDAEDLARYRTDIPLTHHTSIYVFSATNVGERASLTLRASGTSVIEEMRADIEQLQSRVLALEEAVAMLSRFAPSADEDVIVLRTIPREQARHEIRELFEAGETLYYSDISRRLRIDLPLAVELCQELEEEGEIEVDADAL